MDEFPSIYSITYEQLEALAEKARSFDTGFLQVPNREALTPIEPFQIAYITPNLTPTTKERVREIRHR